MDKFVLTNIQIEDRHEEPQVGFRHKPKWEEITIIITYKGIGKTKEISDQEIIDYLNQQIGAIDLEQEEKSGGGYDIRQFLKEFSDHLKESPEDVEGCIENFLSQIQKENENGEIH